MWYSLCLCRVFHPFVMPSAMTDIEQLNCVKLLGVLFQDNLKMDLHVHFLICIS